MTDIKERGDQMEEACGVFGIYAQDESINVAEAAYYGLFALQHRGQESAGIAVADGKGIKHYRNLGLVPEVFDEEILHGLTGRISIGHVRYSTFGSKDVINSQPLVARCKIGMLALAHNGNLVNADALRAQMEDDGAIFQTSVDTEVILSLIARESSKGLIEAIRSMMEKVRGSYALVLLAKDKLIGIRDPYGIRPLCLGRVGNSFVLASESCALDAVGAEFVRDIQPGEIVVIDAEGVHSMHVKTPMRSRLCLFEFVYFARPDSVIDGINVYQSRVEAGKRLAIDDDVEADMVIGVPDRKYGEEAMACIILKEPGSVTEDEMFAYIKASLARHKVPKYIRFTDAFPMNAAGKILKYKMREDATRELGLDGAAGIDTAKTAEQIQ